MTCRPGRPWPGGGRGRRLHRRPHPQARARPPLPSPPSLPQELAAALPGGARARGGAPAAAPHVARYQQLGKQLYTLSLSLHLPAAAATAAAGGAPAAQSPAAAADGGGGGGRAARAAWRRAVTKVTEVNRAKRGAPGALGQLVGSMMVRGDVEATRWCATLLLLVQLGVGLERLQSCLGERWAGGPRGRGGLA